MTSSRLPLAIILVALLPCLYKNVEARSRYSRNRDLKLNHNDHSGFQTRVGKVVKPVAFADSQESIRYAAAVDTNPSFNQYDHPRIRKLGVRVAKPTTFTDPEDTYQYAADTDDQRPLPSSIRTRRQIDEDWGWRNVVNDYDKDYDIRQRPVWREPDLPPWSPQSSEWGGSGSSGYHGYWYRQGTSSTRRPALPPGWWPGNRYYN